SRGAGQELRVRVHRPAQRRLRIPPHRDGRRERRRRGGVRPARSRDDCRRPRPRPGRGRDRSLNPEARAGDRPQPTIAEVLGRVSVWRGLEVACSPLAGGLTNENWVVEAGGSKYVVRIPGASTELLAVDWVNERANAEAAARTGVSPRI